MLRWGIPLEPATDRLAPIATRLVSSRRSSLVVAGLVVLPSLLAVLVSDVAPTGDIALIELRVRDVLSTHPPLTGAYSRYGWDHPGPALFWSAALPYRLLGGDGDALRLVALGLNALGVVVGLRLTARRGAAAWVAVLLGLVGLVVGLGPDALTSIWNPTITNVALVVVALACWGAWCGDRASWLVALVSATFVTQAHVGTGVVVAPLVAVTLVVTARRWRRAGHPPTRRERAAIGAVLAVWLVPVALDAAIDPPGNLARSVRWSLTGDEPTVGWSTAVRLVARSSSLTFLGRPGLDGDVLLDIGRVDTGLLPGVAVAALLACWWAAHRRGWQAEARWCAIVAALWASSLFAASRITLPLGWWLVQWLQPIGWLTWSAVALVAWRLLQRASATVPSPRAWLIGAGALALAGLVAHAIDVADGELETSFETRSLDRLVDAVGPPVDSSRLRIEVAGEPLLVGAMRSGVVAGLERRGIPVCVADPSVAFKVGDDRVCDDADTGRRLLLRLERSGDPPPDGAGTLAVIDPLTVEERRDADRIAAELAVILVGDGRGDEVPVLETPLADVVLLTDPSDALLARADDAHRLAELRAVPGDRYGWYDLG